MGKLIGFMIRPRRVLADSRQMFGMKLASNLNRDRIDFPISPTLDDLRRPGSIVGQRKIGIRDIVEVPRLNRDLFGKAILRPVGTRLQ